MIHEFHTDDSPQRTGHEAPAGTPCWTFTFPLDDGDALNLTMGKARRADFIRILNEESIDDAIEEAVKRGNVNE